MDQDEIEAYKTRIKELRIEHRDLDDVIARLSDNACLDQLQLRRLKKRKLLLKDLIAKLSSDVIPDIMA